MFKCNSDSGGAGMHARFWKNTALLIIIAFTVSCTVTPGIFMPGEGIWDQMPPAINKWADTVVLRDESPNLLLILEYPGGVTPKALALLRDLRRTSQDYGRSDINHNDVWTDDELDQRILDQINKSGYYALRVFDYLKRNNRFPKDTLALRAAQRLDRRHPLGRLPQKKHDRIGIVE
jgi:hypothetical protein